MNIKYFLNPHTYQKDEKFLAEKVTTLNIILIIMSVVLTAFTIFRLSQGHIIQGSIDLALTIIIYSSYIALYKNKYIIRTISRILILFAAIASLSLIIVMPDVDTRFAWIYITIYMMFFLLDLHEGKIWFSILMLCILVFYSLNIIKLSMSEFFIFIISTGLFGILLSRYELIKQSSEEYYQSYNKELKNALRAKSDFLANMSHEIRTPLNAMLGFIEILKKGEKNKTRISQFNIIHNSSQNLLAIINDILDISKLESGNMELELKPFELKAPFEEIQLLFYEKAKENNIKLDLKLHNELPKIVIGDIFRLKQVISNLVSNAIKFTQENGHIIINLEYESKNKKLICKVSDDGIGISKEHLTKIFKSFSQADSSTTRKYGGTGLGLTITQQIIEMMQGSISVESSLGKGSTFTFTIPVELSNEESNAIKKTKLSTTEQLKLNGKVLIVEDNKMNQMLIEIILSELGISHDTVDNGQNAVDIVKKVSYDLILMDENMPVLNGIDATIQIRKLGILTPIVAVTANALPGDRQRFLDAGMDDYISKPIEQEKLLITLRKFLKD